MYMPDETKENSKRINVRIPIELYSRIVQSYGITEAVVQGLERLLKGEEPNTQDKKKELNDGLLHALEARIASLEDQLKIKDSQLDISNSKTEDRVRSLEEQLKVKDSNYQDRITDLKEEITVLRKQLDKKDDTIKNLTTITESQLKGYKLIEAPGAKKPWWRFW
jgi:predicted RNase H-like nuclease (RuvC/YqgF family)